MPIRMVLIALVSSLAAGVTSVVVVAVAVGAEVDPRAGFRETRRSISNTT